MRDGARFRMALRDKHYAERTIESYVEYVRRAQRFLDAAGDGSLRRASPDQVRAFFAGLPPSAASRNQARKALAAYYRFAKVRRPPTDEIEWIPEPEPFSRPLSEADHERFLAACHALGGVHRLVGLLFACTGCRFSEVHKARWHQFDLDRCVWYVEGKGSRRRGPKKRVVPLHSAVVPLLRGWRLESPSPDYLFPALKQSSRPWVSGTTLRKVFGEITDRAGLAGAVPHELRHTVANAVLDRGFNVRVLQELLGHEDLRTTQRYTRVRPERLQAAVETLKV